ncbi:Beta-arabinofuranosyltransferase RAY1 [Diplonema papillatum]|nr:Beta-arabinofuranosyltransferase RAY1 [Diplonema papillatum]
MGLPRPMALLFAFGLGSLVAVLAAGLMKPVPAVQKRESAAEAAYLVQEHFEAAPAAPSEVVKRRLLDVAERRKGVFINKALRPELRNTVVLTMANWGFKNFFFNWACYAKQLGLDYAVLSLDPKLHAFLGESRSVLMDDISGKQAWGSEAYYYMGCHKIEAIQFLLELGYSVLFSDADNVIARMPTQLLDDMIAGNYDMLIQADHPDCKSRDDCPMKWQAGKTANGGFYYASAKRKEITSQLYKRAFDYCMMRPHKYDDQQAVNVAIHELEKGELTPPNAPGSEFCKHEAGAAPDNADSLQFCIMDPLQHPAGKHTIDLDKIVSFHANWITSGSKKVERLGRLGMWQWVGGTCKGDEDP